MPFAVIDCGTTNSRIYLLDENYKIIKKGNKMNNRKPFFISMEK